MAIAVNKDLNVTAGYSTLTGEYWAIQDELRWVICAATSKTVGNRIVPSTAELLELLDEESLELLVKTSRQLLPAVMYENYANKINEQVKFILYAIRLHNSGRF